MSMPDFPGEDIGGVIEAFDTRPDTDGEFFSEHAKPTRHIAPDYSAPQVWQVNNLAVVQILQRRLRRNRADIWVGTIQTPSVPTGTGATGAISAAGAGSAALGNGATITGFQVTFVSATTAAGTATVSNVVGGPYVFNIPTGTANLSVPLSFTASSAAVAPTVTIAAAASATGGNVNVSGTTPSTAILPSIYFARYREPLQALLAGGFPAVPVGTSVSILSQNGQSLAWRAQQELFAIASTAGPFAVNVLDSLYGD